MDDLSIDVLVNKENMLSIDYIPKNMYIVDNNDNNFHNYLIDNIKPMLRMEVKPYIEKLIYDANKSGIVINFNNEVTSVQGYENCPIRS